MRRALTHLVAAVLGSLCLGFAVQSIMAHGIGKPQILNEPAGPYLLSAWTDPDPLRADETHVVVAVTDPDTREVVVTGVEVTVRLTSLGDSTIILTEVAGNDDVNRLLFAAEFNDQVTQGQWRVDLSITGERGAGEIEGFVVDIEAARGFNWLWLGVGGLGVLVVIWFVSSMRGEKPDAGARGRSGMAG